VHSKPRSLKGGWERHFKLQCKKLRWTYIVMLNHDQANHKDHHKDDGSNGIFTFVVRLPIVQPINIYHLLQELWSKAIKCLQTSSVRYLPYYRRCVHKWLWDDHGAWFSSQMNPLLDNWCSFTITNYKQEMHLSRRINFEPVFQSEKT
jgi:hypothetical protein